MLTRTPLALRNFAAQKIRTGVASLGVAVALVLIFMQLGFFGAVVSTAGVVLGRLKFDVLIASRDYQHFYASGVFSRSRLYQAASTQGVREVEPLYLGANLWRCPPRAPGQDSRRRAIFVMGFRPPDSGQETPFRIDEIARHLTELREPETLIMDSESRPEFGDPTKPQDWELGNQKVRPIGTFKLGVGFGSDGTVIMSDQNFLRIFPNRTPSDVSLGLVELEPGVNAAEVAEKLRAKLPGDMVVFTRAQILRKEVIHWVVNTAVGVIFFFGTVVAFLVGIGVVYQVLSSDIADHYAEYATLKAMGYSNRFLSSVILMQAVMLAVMGFLPAVVVSWLLYGLTRANTHMPMNLTPTLGLTVFLLSVAMCATSGFIAIRKVQTTDPANLF